MSGGAKGWGWGGGAPAISPFLAPPALLEGGGKGPCAVPLRVGSWVRPISFGEDVGVLSGTSVELPSGRISHTPKLSTGTFSSLRAGTS